MDKTFAAFAVLPVLLLFQTSVQAPAQSWACCDSGDRVPQPGDLQFVADAHAAGVPGSDITSYPAHVNGPNWPAYPVNVPLFKGLNQRDTNIIYAGWKICDSMRQGLGADTEQQLIMLLGINASVAQSNALVASAQRNICSRR